MGAAATSTQTAGESPSASWDDLSQIPSNQQDSDSSDSTSSGGAMAINESELGNTSNDKGRTHSSSSAPASSPAPPHVSVAVVAGGGGAAAASVGVRAAADAVLDNQVGGPPPRQQQQQQHQQQNTKKGVYAATLGSASPAPSPRSARTSTPPSATAPPAWEAASGTAVSSMGPLRQERRRKGAATTITP